MKLPLFLSQKINEILNVIPNGMDEENVISVCSELISNAKERVHIVSGELESKYFTSGQFISSIKQAAQVDVNIVIVYGPNADKSSIKILKKIPKVVLLKAPKRPSAHYMIVDDNVRIEDYHIPYEASRKAYVIMNTTYLAEKMEREFAHIVYLSSKETEERIQLTNI